MVALYAGLEVSMELTSFCVVDEDGWKAREAKVASEPDATVRELRASASDVVRVGLKDGPLSPWLFFGLHDAAFPVVSM